MPLSRSCRVLACLAVLFAASGAADVLAHGVTQGDQGYIQEITGVNILPFIYLGAKHMVSGYDHILFLVGVIFFLHRLSQVGLYVSLFSLGHSTTLMLGVYFDIPANAYIIDTIIGLSVVYKALDNWGAFRAWFGFQPDTRKATLIFGLFHGFGLATKIQEFEVSPDGLLPNLIAFNVGVEIGQILALAMVLILMGHWRRARNFNAQAFWANMALATAGFVLMGYQLTGYFTR